MYSLAELERASEYKPSPRMIHYKNEVQKVIEEEKLTFSEAVFIKCGDAVTALEIAWLYLQINLSKKSFTTDTK